MCAWHGLISMGCAALPSLPFLSSLLHFGGSWHPLDCVVSVCELPLISHSFRPVPTLSPVLSLLYRRAVLHTVKVHPVSPSPLQYYIPSDQSPPRRVCHCLILNPRNQRPGSSNFHTYYYILHRPQSTIQYQVFHTPTDQL